MLILKYIVCFAAAFSFLACADTNSPQNQAVETETKVEVVESFEVNQYAVYDALIADDDLIPYFSRKSNLLSNESNLLVIIERTNIDYLDSSAFRELLAKVPNRLPSLSKATFDDFRACNKSRNLLKDLFTLSVKRVFISDEELDSFFKRKLYWEGFYKKYPNSQGVMVLSNVGFDAQKKQALVYVSNSRGSLDAIGVYVVLEKQNDVWRVKEKYEAWAS
ncbi:MAG: hypothetical protein H0X72_01645 [Acidobacteria bacterium]|nr:hypothetical protein [Acidobacteriota bacterium]